MVWVRFGGVRGSVCSLGPVPDCDAPCKITCMVFMDFLYLTNVFVLTSCEHSVFMNPFLKYHVRWQGSQNEEPFRFSLA